MTSVLMIDLIEGFGSGKYEFFLLSYWYKGKASSTFSFLLVYRTPRLKGTILNMVDVIDYPTETLHPIQKTLCMNTPFF